MPKLFAGFFVLAAFTFGVYGQSVCAVDSKTHKPKNCCNATSFGDCPADGCGVDLLLNTAKNRTDLPNEADVQQKTIAKIAAFKRPKKWSWNQSRALLESWGEGTPLRVTLFLQHVENYKAGAEACNCNLTGDGNNDYHLVLGRTANAPEKQSLTAEISPRIRRTNWDYDRLKELAKQKTYVRVTGWAMLGTQHIGDQHPIRRTHWEIHPVTKFEI
ncbi:MAG: hypothetical protein ABIO36_06490, partial [Pyrinomonadaceae bacterium]